MTVRGFILSAVAGAMLLYMAAFAVAAMFVEPRCAAAVESWWGTVWHCQIKLPR